MRTAAQLIQDAYTPQSYWSRDLSRFENAPSWLDQTQYVINAKVAPEDVETWKEVQSLDQDVIKGALRAILRDHFKLQMDVIQVQVNYLDLLVGKHGAKLYKTVPGQVKPVPGKSHARGKGFYIDGTENRRFVGVSMGELAELLTRLSPDIPVQDKTGLDGRYDFTLPWYGQNNHEPRSLGLMPISDAGLVLKRGKGPAYRFRINHIELPEFN